MNEDRPRSAFLISLIGGVFILLGNVAMAMMMSIGLWWMGMSGEHYDMMGFFSLATSLMIVLVAFGAVCGAVVIAASFMLNSRPQRSVTWGAVVLAFSVLSLIGMGGFFIGAVLGIVGGAMAITWQGSR